MATNYSKNYIITAAQYNGRVNRQLMSSLEKLADERNAEILIFPLAGQDINDDRWPTALEEHEIITSNRKLNDKIRVADFGVRPNQIRPLTGISRFTQNDVTTITPSTKQHLQVIPNSISTLPKILMSTGVVTYPRYNMRHRINKIAQRDHTFGAVYVELEDKVNYHFRHLQATHGGKFVDLGMEYSPKKDPERTGVEALVLGDLHCGDHDSEVLEANYRMIEEYKPKRIVLHDFFNGHSVNHHLYNKLVTRADYTAKGRHSLASELELAATMLEEIVERGDGAEIIIPACNHHDFLTKYLESGQFTREPHNLYIASKLLSAVLDGKDPVETGINYFYGTPRRVRFLGRDDDYKVRGWQLGVHGDKGANGARRSVTALENAYGKSITGHAHTPAIFHDVYVVGTSTKLRLDYNDGPSSWMNTNALLYDNGKAQLVNIVNGRWKKNE